MTNPDSIARDYLAAWNAPDEVERLRRLDRWAEDARYVDPLMQAVGGPASRR